MAIKDYAAACPKLAESQALAPAADTAFDLAICYQAASQLAFKAASDLGGIRAQEDRTATMPSLPAPPSPSASTPGQTQRTVGLVVGGAGVAGLIAGVIAGVMAKSEWDQAHSAAAPNVAALQGHFQSAQELSTASTISLVSGAVGLGAGAIVFFTAPKSASPGPTVGLGPAPQGTGLALAGRF
jgi:serine/threonine-protein kinase